MLRVMLDAICQFVVHTSQCGQTAFGIGGRSQAATGSDGCLQRSHDMLCQVTEHGVLRDYSNLAVSVSTR
jgi:hypothetical protein